MGGRRFAASDCIRVNDAVGPQHQRLQQPLLQRSETRRIEAVAAPLIHLACNFFAGHCFAGILKQGLEMQACNHVHALLRVAQLLLLLGAGWWFARFALDPQRNV